MAVVAPGGRPVLSGIPAAQYEMVLKRFYRVHHHLIVGSGLGLAIVDKAIQQLGGHFELSKSQDLGGLAARVTLPLHYHKKELLSEV